MRLLLLLGAAYLLGSIPFGVLISRARGVDIRRLGSGNIGFSNVLRTLGPRPAAIVLLADVAKGALPVLAGRPLLVRWGLADPDLWVLALALAPIAGHSFSVFLGFQGGRAVATTLGVLLAMAWPAALLGLGVWVLLVATTRYISVGSMAGAAAVPIYLAWAGVRWEWLAFWCAIAALVIFRHVPNLQRLLAGTEARIGERVAGPR